MCRIDRPLRQRKTLKQQINWLRQQFKESVCLVQVGCYYEAYDNDAKILAKAVDLKLLRKWRGFDAGCGFPQRHLNKIVFALKRERIPVVVVKQSGREMYKAKERLVDLILDYPKH